jgi:TPP-dependent pyruvate/acetoin dehydrogenase alpha subunit
MAADLDLAGVYRQMLRIREFEERMKATLARTDVASAAIPSCLSRGAAPLQ